MWVNRRCRRIAACLWEYSNGDLPTAEMERVRIHLMECRPCRNALDAARQTASLVASLRDAAGPTSATNFQDLIDRLDSRQRRPAPNFQSALMLCRITVACVALAAVVLIEVRAHKSVNVPLTPPVNESLPRSAGEEKVLAIQPERHWLKPTEIAAAHDRDSFRPIQVKAIRSAASVRLASAHHHARKSATSGNPLGIRLYAAVNRHQSTEMAERASAGKDAAKDAAIRSSEAEQSQTDLQPQPVMLPVVGPGGGRGRSCAFVIDGIPTTTLTGQAGTVATEAQNPETGRAL